MDKTKDSTILALVDKMIGGLCRGVPGDRRTSFIFPRDEVSRFRGSFHLLGGYEVATTIPGLVHVKIDSAVAYESLMATRAILELLYDQIPKISRFPAQEQLTAYKCMLAWSTEDFVPFMKYVTVYPLARFMRDKENLPPKPAGFCNNPLLFSGRIKKVLKNRLVSFTPRNASLFQGWLQGVKRGCARAPEVMIFNSFVKHRKAMLKEPTYDYETLDSFTSYCQRLFRGFRPSRPKLYEPSSSASFQYQRGWGGQREFLRRAYIGAESGSSEGFDIRQFGNFLVQVIEDFPELGLDFTQFLVERPEGPEKYKGFQDSLVLAEDLISLDEVRPGFVQESRGLATWTSYDNYIWHIRDLWKEAAAGSNPKTNSSRLRAADPFGFERLSDGVKVSAVIEPLKVRLVTKGDSYKYYLAKWFQKELWKHLQKFPQFVLTGTPLQQSHLHDMLGREQKLNLTGFNKFVSGDYSAATDNLKMKYSKVCFTEAVCRAPVPLFDKSQLCATLFEQDIYYPQERFLYGGFSPEEVRKLDPIRQRNGQLMGSPESFPILCYINLIGYWMALEIFTQRRIKARDLPVLVNGDDILFRCSDEFYPLWKNITEELGFELSQGKNYVSESLLMINSELFWFNREGSFAPIPYFNIGLLTGQAKLTGRMSERLSPLWDYYNKVLSGSRSKYRAHQRFLHYHKENIRQLSRSGDFNLFVHRLYGGLGFRMYPEVAPHVTWTNFQKKLALYLRSWIKSPYEGELYQIPVLRTLVPEEKGQAVLGTHKYHFGRYRTVPRTAPLERDEREVLDPMSILEQSRFALSLDTAKVVMQCPAPNSAVMANFRRAKLRNPSGSQIPAKFMEYEYRVVEKVEQWRDNRPLPGLIESNPGPCGMGFIHNCDKRSLQWRGIIRELSPIPAIDATPSSLRSRGSFMGENGILMYGPQPEVWRFGYFPSCHQGLTMDLVVDQGTQWIVRCYGIDVWLMRLQHHGLCVNAARQGFSEEYRSNLWRFLQAREARLKDNGQLRERPCYACLTSRGNPTAKFDDQGVAWSCESRRHPHPQARDVHVDE